MSAFKYDMDTINRFVRGGRIDQSQRDRMNRIEGAALRCMTAALRTEQVDDTAARQNWLDEFERWVMDFDNAIRETCYEGHYRDQAWSILCCANGDLHNVDVTTAIDTVLTAMMWANCSIAYERKPDECT